MSSRIINCISSFTINNSELKSIRSNQECIETVYQLKSSTFLLNMLKVVGNLVFLNLMGSFTKIHFEDVSDHMLVVVPFLVLYNMAKGIEALYLGYLYSFVFWLRTAACLCFFLADIRFFIVLLDLKEYTDIKILYAAALVLVIIWIVLAIVVIVKYRPGKVKRMEIKKIKFALTLAILGGKGLVTIGISILWRYILYSDVQQIVD